MSMLTQARPGVALLVGCVVVLACLRPGGPSRAQDAEPEGAVENCTVVYTESTTGAGQCPGGQGSACETQIYTKSSRCEGNCPANKPYCVSKEKTLQVVYRKWVYQGNCNPPSNCVLVSQETRAEMITSACDCSAMQAEP